MNRFPISLSARLAAILIAGSCLVWACGPAQPGPGSDPRFEWFEYTGSDPAHEANPLAPGQFANPILGGFYPDPSIVRVEEDYYLVNSTFSWFPGIPVFHSRDLVRWTQIGNVFDRPEQLNLDSLRVSEGVFAPTIRYHDGRFFVVVTLVGAGGNAVMTATDPAGPWSDPVFLPSIEGIDPDLFFDDDGRAWIAHNGPPPGPPQWSGHRALWIQQFDPDSLKTVGPRTLIVDGGVDPSRHPVWIEGPHLMKVRGQYFLIAAEGGTAEDHSVVVFRGAAATGPFEPYSGNPILTQRDLADDRPYPVTSTGHADLVQTPDGNWWAVFLGCRPYADGLLYNTGRETFMLPVDWSGTWPEILPAGAVVPYAVQGPEIETGSTPRLEPTHVPHSGSFSVREDFNGPEIPPDWVTLRTPREAWWSLEEGRLLVRARHESLAGRGQPSFLGRRQAHAYATATTSMLYRPVSKADRAGLAVIQQEDAWFLLSIARGEDGPEARLERRWDGKTETVASRPVELPADGRVLLQIAARGPDYSFAYSTVDSEWTPLAEDVDGTILSTRRAGGFTGAIFGVFAYSDRNP